MFGFVLVLCDGGLILMNVFGVGVLEICVLLVFLLKILEVLYDWLLVMFLIVTWWCG